MDACDQHPSAHDADAINAHRHEADTVALWLALAADRRSRDERTDRLRVMRLIGGEDEEA